MAAKAPITITNGTGAKIPALDLRRYLAWKVLSGTVKVSRQPGVDGTTGITYTAGQGESIAGERIDCQNPVYFHATADAVVEWDSDR